MESGCVFNIERCAIEDGKGIRTVVFLKGCSLRCLWCANPESQSFTSEVIYNENLCNGCGKCITSCNKGAVKFDLEYGYISDSDLCIACSDCIDACLYNARTLSGIEMTSRNLIKELVKDEAYFKESGGGVTFSGGEPLFQSAFIRESAIALKERDIPILIETCGHVSRKHIEEIIDVTEVIYFDIKTMDSEKHRKLTGEGNELILDNLIYLDKHFKGELVVRYPYIPDMNDSEKDIDQAIEFVEGLTSVQEMAFLPYHRLGLPKYRGLGREYHMGKRISLKKNDLYPLLERYKEKRLNIRIQ
jgi:pyruvate formate lyase activating enzyme